MTYHVELTLQAEQDIDHILDWLRRRSPQGAATWFRRWNQVLADLSKNASSCRLAPENDDHDDEIRNLVSKHVPARNSGRFLSFGRMSCL